MNPAAIDKLPPAIRTPIRGAFSHSLETVFLVAVPFAVLAFVLSWLMKEIPLRTTAFNPPSARRGDGNGDGPPEDAAVEVPVEVAAL